MPQRIVVRGTSGVGGFEPELDFTLDHQRHGLASVRGEKRPLYHKRKGFRLRAPGLVTLSRLRDLRRKPGVPKPKARSPKPDLSPMV